MDDQTREDLMTRLSQHRALANAPVLERAWLVEHGTLRTFAVGDVVTAKGTQAKSLYVLLEGHMVIRVDRGAGSHILKDWNTGDVGGAMPYSRGASPPSDSVAEEPSKIFAVPKETFPDMIRECPEVTTILVHEMLDRARDFTSSELRDEKLISLGKLAAGLAHELNNPASAVVRSAKTLTQSLTAAELAARKLAAANLSDEQFSQIESARVICSTPQASAPLSSMARADREDVIGAWLADHGADEEYTLALADTGVSVDALDRLAAGVNPEALDASLQWIAACCLVRSLSSEIESASTRIYDLVSAVKGFTYMDHAPTSEPVDIRKGINETVQMLGSKTRAKSVEISVDLPSDLPRAHAVGAELNQVWMNLIDNAVDAVGPGGHVNVTATKELDSVVVHIIDDGPGIPEETKQHIFEPFYTTKPVGKGTGLGLDISKRILKKHNGALDFDSEPGRTDFQVRLPAEK